MGNKNTKAQEIELLQTREIKIALVGARGVGKTTMMHQFAAGKFVDNVPELEEPKMKKTEFGGVKVNLELTDTSGTGDFGTVDDLKIRQSDGILVVFSLDSQASFDMIPGFMSRIRYMERKEDLPVFCIANKCDLEDHAVDPDWASKISEFNFANHFETSNKQDESVTDVIDALVQLTLVSSNQPVAPTIKKAG